MERGAVRCAPELPGVQQQAPRAAQPAGWRRLVASGCSVLGRAAGLPRLHVVGWAATPLTWVQYIALAAPLHRHAAPEACCRTTMPGMQPTPPSFQATVPGAAHAAQPPHLAAPQPAGAAVRGRRPGVHVPRLWGPGITGVWVVAQAQTPVNEPVLAQLPRKLTSKAAALGIGQQSKSRQLKAGSPAFTICSVLAVVPA